MMYGVWLHTCAHKTDTPPVTVGYDCTPAEIKLTLHPPIPGTVVQSLVLARTLLSWLSTVAVIEPLYWHIGPAIIHTPAPPNKCRSVEMENYVSFRILILVSIYINTRPNSSIGLDFGKDKFSELFKGFQGTINPSTVWTSQRSWILDLYGFYLVAWIGTYTLNHLLLALDTYKYVPAPIYTFIDIHCICICICEKIFFFFKYIYIYIHKEFYIFSIIINRPGVAGAVLHTVSSLIQSLMVCGNIFKTLWIPNRQS